MPIRIEQAGEPHKRSPGLRAQNFRVWGEGFRVEGQGTDRIYDGIPVGSPGLALSVSLSLCRTCLIVRISF